VQIAVPDVLPVVDGVVDRIIYVGADGHTVAILATGDHEETVKVSGVVLAGLQPGETVRVHGQWVSSARHASTLRVAECERVLPATVHAIRCYLGSGLIKGIGPTIAQAIVNHFGTDTLEIIDTAPARLLEVHLIGRARQALIKQGWRDQRAIRDVMIFLQGVGVSPSLAVRIHKELGADSLRIVQEQPYQLIEHVRGVGFLTADKIALSIGVPEQSPARLQAALIHALDEQRGKAGHCYLPYSALVHAAAELVNQDIDLVRDALHRLRDQSRVVVEPSPGEKEGDEVVVFPVWVHRAETTLADNLRRLMAAPSHMPRAVVARYSAAEPGDGPQPPLSERQVDAVRMAYTRQVSILTGGPGCGKSHTVGAIAQHAKRSGATVTLAAPTGRAAKRLTELTGLRAMTVHRLMYDRYHRQDDDGGLFDVGDPLQADLVIVDEASMLDVTLAAKLTSAIPSGSHLLLVGDVDQLPSIGPGSVLHDLLDVETIPSIRLDTVYRQGPGSSIIDNAHRVVTGQQPINSNEFWFHRVEDDAIETLADLVVDIATRRLPAKQQITPHDIQVLCPAKTTDTGARNLGRLIQDKLNPHHDDRPHHWADERAFRLGDKIMPTRNDYTKGSHGVFNGSTGTITAINTDEQHIQVALDDGETVTYEFDELDELAHAYAITVHRAQGSEYPYVVIPLAKNTPFLLLQRNLLYTAITRAKKMVIIVGHEQALKAAVRKMAIRRNTLLTQRLLGLHQANPHAGTALRPSTTSQA
jgi:exodeoxyribonuclease V alpha subunit